MLQMRVHALQKVAEEDLFLLHLNRPKVKLTPPLRVATITPISVFASVSSIYIYMYMCIHIYIY